MSTDNQMLGVIDPDQLYTLTAFTRRLGIRDATVRAARRAGLRVYYVHRNAYIYGGDWIDYVLKSRKGQEDEPSVEASPEQDHPVAQSQ